MASKLLPALFILLLAAPAAAAGPYRIGVIIPLSGTHASWGSYVRRGIELAYANLPEKQRKEIEVIFEDDQFESAKTVSNYQRLISVNGIKAAFVAASPAANAIGPLCEREKIILMAVGASDPAIAVGKQYSFVHWVIPPILGEHLSQELVRRDFGRIAVLASEATGALADAEALAAAYEKRGLSSRLVFRDSFPRGQTDFRSTIALLKQKKPSAVVVVLFPGSLAAFARQFREASLPAELVGMETFEDEAEVKAAQGALLGAWYVNASDPSPKFLNEYRERYGEHPGWGAANAYDSLMLIAEGVRTRGGDNDRIRDFLRTVKDYSGAAGTYSASGDNRFTLPGALKRVTENGFENMNP